MWILRSISSQTIIMCCLVICTFGIHCVHCQLQARSIVCVRLYLLLMTPCETASASYVHPEMETGEPVATTVRIWRIVLLFLFKHRDC
ncbi:hypothetical protein BC832DRAFT_559022 [Gaertneriomyces semiglobifer]|nr:hypothetical protein BC832DRAFT_559022 [Gaertneriomyces semiglobifer]